MCGRFRIARKKEALEESFGAEAVLDDPEWVPRYNVAPGQEIAAVRQDPLAPRRSLSRLRWGLIPAWAKDAAIGYKLINARAETAAERPSFRDALRLRRCLIPADGFYEWQRSRREKQPYCFALKTGEIFALAGLWERWRSPQGEIVESCTVLTTTPNELMRDVHDRMPVILPPEAYETWLDPGFRRVDELMRLLRRPYPAMAMRRFRVGPRVNSVKYDDAECSAELEVA